MQKESQIFILVLCHLKWTEKISLLPNVMTSIELKLLHSTVAVSTNWSEGKNGRNCIKN